MFFQQAGENNGTDVISGHALWDADPRQHGWVLYIHTNLSISVRSVGVSIGRPNFPYISARIGMRLAYMYTCLQCFSSAVLLKEVKLIHIFGIMLCARWHIAKFIGPGVLVSLFSFVLFGAVLALIGRLID